MSNAVMLYTHDNKFVAEITVMPFLHWPQCLVWGERFFVRRDCIDDISCTQIDPPDYFEIVPVAVVEPFGEQLTPHRDNVRAAETQQAIADGAEIRGNAKCALCGKPMPPGEQMFQYHGYSGPCPKD